jgi:hypothetical protein
MTNIFNYWQGKGRGKCLPIILHFPYIDEMLISKAIQIYNIVYKYIGKLRMIINCVNDIPNISTWCKTCYKGKINEDKNIQ